MYACSDYLRRKVDNRHTDRLRRFIVQMTGSLMKQIAVFAFVSMQCATARADLPVDAYYSQCVIESYSETGKNFEKENKSETDKDRAYRNWMLLCMEAKGFQYDGDKCPPNKDATLQATEKSCYKEM